MGGIAEALVAYARPLIDQTDGSEEDLNKAFALTQFCHNFAIMPEDGREEVRDALRQSLQMGDEDFEDFWQSLIVPMIQRHEEMFPGLHRRRFARSAVSGSSGFTVSGPAGFAPGGPLPQDRTATRAVGGARRGTDRYAPCPCNSGKKYKFCCGKKSH